MKATLQGRVFDVPDDVQPGDRIRVEATVIIESVRVELADVTSFGELNPPHLLANEKSASVHVAQAQVIR